MDEAKVFFKGIRLEPSDKKTLMFVVFSSNDGQILTWMPSWWQLKLIINAALHVEEINTTSRYFIWSLRKLKELLPKEI